jgi:hypothetical protein
MDPTTVDAIIAVAFFFALVTVVKIISEGLLKRKVLAAHMSVDLTREFVAWTRDAGRDDALKWGLVWIGIGSGLVLIDWLPYDVTDPIAYGLIFIFGGVALLVYRSITARAEPRRETTSRIDED